MKLKEIFELCVKEGVNADPRGKEGIEKLLKKRKEQYEKLEKEDKEYYDKEKLWNPYDDTRIIYDNGKEIKTVLLGIDMEGSEILLANELNKQGKKIDAVWAHHPEGKALMGLDNVMRLQIEILAKGGMPINQAEAAMNERIKEVYEALSPLNPERIEQTAKLLKLPFLNTHTPADNYAHQFFLDLFEKKKPETIGDIIKLIKDIPEYKHGMEQKIGPTIFCGSEENYCGKIHLEMTGGTEPNKAVFEKLAQSGTGTIIAMHVSKELKKEAEKNHMNIIIAGHIPSDNLGLNLMLDKIEKKAKLNIIECSGFKRIKRN